jgi:Flp pilus assembly protein TadD
LELNIKDPDARVDMGICYNEMGDDKSALKEMEEAIEFAPKHQKAHFNIGIINLKEGNLQKANEYFKKCYELDPATTTGMQAKEILDQHQNLKSNNK